MFIKLTRFDNRPVWLNAAFVVTVEPRRDGNGAVVVPIGDGLDYDVRENPEEVLRMLDGCPGPKVVPVPVSDCLAPTPADVSPEPEHRRPVEEKPVEIKPAEAEPAPEKTADEKSVDEKAAEEKPKRKTVRERAKKAAEEKPKRKTVRERAKKTVAPKKAKKPVLELSDEDVVRLQKLSPKSVAKLKNTLASQFRVADVSETVAALEAKGILALDGNHVNWKTE